MAELTNKTVILGVSGGIAAYKSVAVASQLVQKGARVHVVLTDAAQRFIQPLTFSAITHNDVHTDPFAPWQETFSGHVSLARDADVLIVAPATAASIARLAIGLSDDLIGLVALSTTAPILLAPAMEENMLLHPATQDHLAALAARGVVIVPPESGRLASGATGLGRMADPEVIVAAAERLLHPGQGLLRDKRIVVTAGGTREAIDPVRFIGNRSSGRMGHAIAAAATHQGAEVILITSVPVADQSIASRVVPVESAQEMLEAVRVETEGADALVMAAAVADFRPEHRHESKIKKERGQDILELRLIRNPDILAEVNQPGLLKIGFAAETENLVENAGRKLAEKGLAMIVANEATATIGASDVEATILTADGTAVSLPRMAKDALAEEIVRRIADLLAASQRAES